MPDFLDNELTKKLTGIAIRQIQTSAKFKQDRLTDIRKSYELYYGKKRKTLEGQIIASLPIMPGFADTLLSKIDEPPKVNFGYTDLADYKRSRKTQASWEQESDTNHANWNLKDRWEKKFAIFQGRGTSKIYAESDPAYKSRYDVIDLANFHFEPKGGGHLKMHDFCGEENIWRSKSQLFTGAKSGLYQSSGVRKLIRAVSDDDRKRNTSLYKDAVERYHNLGLDMEANNYVGIPTYRLVEWYMTYGGKRYYLLFEYETGICIRPQLLKDVFKSEEWPYVSWATHPEADNFLSKAPADDARPLCTIMDRLFSQLLTNREKINCQQRGYVADMIPNPDQLYYKPDGLVEINLKPGVDPRAAIYEFKVQNIGTGTIDLLSYIDGILGLKSGVTAAAQGVSEEERVGIHFSNLQQVADRIANYNKSYNEAGAEKGQKYWHGLKEHLTEPMAIKILGATGLELKEELTEDDVKPISDFDIKVTGGSSEEQTNVLKKKDMTESLAAIRTDPELKLETNKKVLTKKTLELGGFEEADIKLIMDKDNEGNMELICEAEQAIQDILRDKEPNINRSATTFFIQYIIDWAVKKIDFHKKEGKRKEKKKQEWYNKMMAYAQAHIEIAKENGLRALKVAPIMAEQPKQTPAVPPPQPAGRPEGVQLPVRPQVLTGQPV